MLISHSYFEGDTNQTCYCADDSLVIVTGRVAFGVQHIILNPDLNVERDGGSPWPVQPTGTIDCCSRAHEVGRAHVTCQDALVDKNSSIDCCNAMQGRLLLDKPHPFAAPQQSIPFCKGYSGCTCCNSSHVLTIRNDMLHLGLDEGMSQECLRDVEAHSCAVCDPWVCISIVLCSNTKCPVSTSGSF